MHQWRGTTTAAILLTFASAIVAHAQIEFDLALNHEDFLFRGPERYDYAGQALAFGDVNGDGFEDLIVGSFLRDGPAGDRVDAGLVSVLFGPQLDPSAGLIPERVLQVFGAEPGDKLGLSVAAGDLNGDGLDDVIISASGVDGPAEDLRDEASAVVVIYGRAVFGTTTIDLNATAPDLILHAPDAEDSFGGAFQFVPVAVGNLDGDEFEDLVVGLPGGDGPLGDRDSAGELHVVFGSDSLPTSIDLRSESPMTLYGVDPGDLLGVAVAVGNFNGDAFEDIVGGAKNSQGPLNGSSKVGEAIGVFGSAGLPAVVDFADGKSAYDFIVYGIDLNDRSARSLAAGDLNGDLIEDLVIGSRHADGSSNTPDQESAGEVYVLLGQASLSGDYFLEFDAAFVIHGEDPNDSIGYSVAVGDVNGDGYGDLITGGEFADGISNGRPRSGEVAVVFGGPALPASIDLLTEQPDIRVHGERAQDSLGAAVAAGDWNGDGVDDLAMGGTGRVYKQLDIPRADQDFFYVSEGGGAWVLRGSSVMVSVGASPAHVPPGSSFLLSTTLSNLRSEAIAMNLRVNWLQPFPPHFTNLKDKQIALGASQTRDLVRTFPLSPDLPDGFYEVQIVLRTTSGELLDCDRAPIEIRSP